MIAPEPAQPRVAPPAGPPAPDTGPDGGADAAPEAPPSPAPPPHPSPEPLLEPGDGLPPVIADPEALADAARRLAAGHGPVAVDAERASGYRYGQRAYLVQLRRSGTGTLLIDPTGVPDLVPVGEAVGDVEWVLHAASQDLPCLAEVGMRPSRLFDTELAGRLAGYPRVGLGPLVEHVLGLSLEKGHSAADWSKRPLPEDWLRYAALDVEVLVDLRDALATELDRQGKLDWALEEFAAIAAAPPPPPRVDPWRRTSGLHRVRKRRQLAAVRELWLTRDRLAEENDISPGRLLPDASIVAAASAMPADAAALLALPAFTGRGSRRHVRAWMSAVDRARHLPESALPPVSLPAEGPPPARSWGDRDPAAAARLAAARERLGALAGELGLPVENLLAPDTVRRLAWSPPPDVEAALHAAGVRGWQVTLTRDLLRESFAAG